jgi:hypothetical protein
VEVQAARLADAPPAHLGVARHVGLALEVELEVAEVAVDLVGAGEQQGTASRRSRSASSRATVARTLMSKSETGSTMLVVTATWAARWNTAEAS